MFGKGGHGILVTLGNEKANGKSKYFSKLKPDKLLGTPTVLVPRELLATSKKNISVPFIIPNLLKNRLDKNR